MALSYDTLDNEAAWRAQTVPPALESLGAGLRAHYGVGRDRIGSPGNNLHLRGGHRSRRWILQSAYCTNRTYTVTYTADKLGDEDWYSAIDIDPDDQAELIAMTRRLDAACRAGLFPEISEWFGNLGGDSVVDGWNNITKRPASSDSSHLSHTHITLLRQYANSQPLMDRLLATLIGTEGETMSVLVRLKDGSDGGKVWLSDGIVRRWVKTPTELNAIKAAAKAGYLVVANGGAYLDVASLAPYGRDVDEVKPVEPGRLVLSAEDRAAIVVDLVAAVRAEIAAVPQATADLVHADLAD